jgi:hypothetical protein
MLQASILSNRWTAVFVALVPGPAGSCCGSASWRGKAHRRRAGKAPRPSSRVGGVGRDTRSRTSSPPLATAASSPPLRARRSSCVASSSCNQPMDLLPSRPAALSIIGTYLAARGAQHPPTCALRSAHRRPQHGPSRCRSRCFVLTNLLVASRPRAGGWIADAAFTAPVHARRGLFGSSRC